MEEGKMKKKRALKEKAVVIFVAAAFIAMVLSIPLYLFVLVMWPFVNEVDMEPKAWILVIEFIVFVLWYIGYRR